MRTALYWTAVATAGLIGACQGVERMEMRPIEAGIPSVYTYGASDGRVEVAVHGNPYAIDPYNIEAAALARVVAGALEGAPYGPPARMVPLAPPAVPRDGFVVAFAPATAPTAAGLCGGEAPQAAAVPAGAAVPFTMVFCGTGIAHSEVAGTVAPGAGPGTPDFAAAMARAAALLVPPVDPLNRNDDDYDP